MHERFWLKRYLLMFCQPDRLAQRIEWRGQEKYAKVSRGPVISSSPCKYILSFFFFFLSFLY